MKIAFITFEYPPLIIGGAGIYAKNITEKLAELGHEVYVIKPLLDTYEYVDSKNKNIILHHIRVKNMRFLKSLSFWLNLRKQFEVIEKKVGGFDIIHSNRISGLSLKNVSNIPRVVTPHHLAAETLRILKPPFKDRITNIGGELGMGPYFEKKCITHSDKVIAISRYVRESIVRVWGIPYDRIAVIYNGVNPEEYNFKRKELEDVITKFDITKKTILYVGRINDPRKNLVALLKAFKLILNKIDAKLIIAGRGDIKRYNHLLPQSENNITVTGYINDITLKKLYSASDVFVLPSKLEGFGLSIVEAMAAGKPVVATSVGAIPEIIENGKNGLLVHPSDIEGLSNAVYTYLEDDKLAKKVGERNFKYVRENFTWKKSAIELERVYKELIDH